MNQISVPRKGLDRRRFLAAGAGVVAGAGLSGALAWPQAASARRPTLPAPDPIPSVVDPALPIHIQLAGPTDVTLLYSQTTLFGLNHERTTVGNFNGTVAWGYLLGTATGSDGIEYGLEVDLRVSEGEYRAADGSMNRGLFALI